MPYDPDWDLGEQIGADIYALDAEAEDESLSSERGSNGQDDEEEEPGGSDQGPVGLKGDDDTEADLPGSPQRRSSQQDRQTTPRNRLPFPGADVVGRPQVEVVLQSTPRRASFTVLPGELTGTFDDGMDLVTSDIVPKPTTKQEQVAAKAQVAPPKPQPPGAPAPLPILTPQLKKRGRPVGWRVGNGSYSALRAGLPPGSSTPRPEPKKPITSEQKVKRRGRKPAPTARQLYLKLNPHFVTFRCEWENCPAELHNLETLRKHLLIVHGRPYTSSTSSASSPASSKQPLPCRWSNCTAAALPSRDSFTAHIEAAHLLPQLWHVGDGPRNSTPSPRPRVPDLPTITAAAAATSATRTTRTTASSTATNPVPSYLLDARGEQVTPSVGAQQLENDDDRRRRQVRLNRVLARRDRNAPPEPDYSARELEMIGEVMSAKRARQRMFREYAERVCGGGRNGMGRGMGMEGWKP